MEFIQIWVARSQPLTEIQERMAAACTRAGRAPSEVQLVAVSKTHGPAAVDEAVACGLTVFGESRVQEANAKMPECPSGLTWHLIGHLQRNKVKLAVQLFDSIQTVDSLRLAEVIDKECRKIERVMPILIEVNADREPQKSGVLPEAAIDLIREIARLEGVRIRGLMTMGALVGDPEELRPVFSATKSLFDRITASQIPNVSMEVLSMGMSASYAVAIEEGATMIRLGTTIFGPRV